MKLAIMQPYFFPYIGYFQLINTVDKFVVYDDVNYINRGWINRNRILVNGVDHLFTLPLVKASQNMLIRDIEVLDDISWKNKIIKTIEISYQKAPEFERVKNLIEETIFSTEKNLSKFLVYSLKRILYYLDIKTEIIESSSSIDTSGLKGEDRIIKICREIGAKEYINPIGGTELYSKEKFKEYGLELYFLNTNKIEYKQFNNVFVPFLSIIDVLMFNSKDSVKLALNNYELI